MLDQINLAKALLEHLLRITLMSLITFDLDFQYFVLKLNHHVLNQILSHLEMDLVFDCDILIHTECELLRERSLGQSSHSNGNLVEQFDADLGEEKTEFYLLSKPNPLSITISFAYSSLRMLSRLQQIRQE